jgi:hypothetical protein
MTDRRFLESFRREAKPAASHQWRRELGGSPTSTRLRRRALGQTAPLAIAMALPIGALLASFPEA